MHSTAIDDPAAQARRAGWKSFRTRTASLFGALEPEEADWAPDEGIASMRDHVRAVATAARELRATVDGDARRRAPRPTPHDAGFQDMIRAIDHCHRAIDERLDAMRPEDEAAIGLDVALVRHVQLVAHHAAAAALLAQLIDPTRDRVTAF